MNSSPLSDSSLSGHPTGLIVMTASALGREHPAMVERLLEAGCVFSWVSQWMQMLHAEDADRAHVLLVDLDAANRVAAAAPALPSGYRVTQVLARTMRAESALIVLTTLDFAEIEELALPAVRAFVNPHHGADECAAQILATARARRTGPLAPMPIHVGGYLSASEQEQPGTQSDS